MRKWQKFGLLTVSAAMLLGAGYYVGRSKLAKANAVLDILETGCIYAPSEDAMLEGAAAGVAGTVDDVYTQYLNKWQMQALDDMVAAADGPGFGLEAVAVGEGLRVVDVGDASPAELAGLAPGDIITAVNGERAADTDALAVFSEGDRVQLRVQRGGNMRDTTVYIKQTAALPDVVCRDIGDVRYIRLRSFMQEECEYEFNKAVDSAPEKLVVDLRGNPGGRLEAALAIAERFIPAGEQVIRFAYTKSGDEYCSQRGDLHGKKLVLLVDRNSASASEIVAGALKHYGYTLVGETTFGKGLVQSIERLGDGSGLKYTCAEYILPGDEHINGVGVAPQEQVQLGSVEYVPGWGLEEQQDMQLQHALQLLQ